MTSQEHEVVFTSLKVSKYEILYESAVHSNLCM